ncbi:MAG: TRAP transporter large permease [Spirochaetaceae bacterium]|jgi:tripartite ATP-independent transporter DctM subunit|nr:TRAP transporter large permease [Spirochaetaceae bacterium]
MNSYVWVLFTTFIVLLGAGIPVAFSLGISSTLYFALSGLPLQIAAQRFFAGLDSFTLLCVPGFILAGNLMNNGGITPRIVGFCNKLVGHIRGGLSLANIVASMIFAGISGTAVADSASLGAILIPAMKEEGYEPDFSVGVTAASSCIGPIIPPSVPMIIAGTMTGLSVSKMFVAGIVPGILMGFGMMAVSYYISCKRRHPKTEKMASIKEILISGRDAFWALLMTLIILVGIIGGICTPTEAAIIAVIYAFVVGIFVYRALPFKDIPRILTESAITSASIAVLVGCANIFAYIMSKEQIPQMVANAMLSFTRNKVVILLLINILLLFVGCFMETIAALLILFPVLLQVATAVGVHPIQFGIIMVLNLVLGLTTPPVGVCLFVTSSIGKISLAQAAKGVLPFLAVNIIVLFFITYCPPLTLGLVKLIFGTV